MEGVPWIPLRLLMFSGGAVVVAGIMLFAVPALLMWLWNLTVPQVFGLRPLTYWQAFRLAIIASILFGGTRFSWGM